MGKWRQVGGRPIGLVSPVFAREGPGCGGVGALEHRFPCPVLYEYQQVQVPRTHGLGLMSRESDTPALLSPPCILSPPTRLTVTAAPGILVGGDSRDSEDKGLFSKRAALFRDGLRSPRGPGSSLLFSFNL